MSVDVHIHLDSLPLPVTLVMPYGQPPAASVMLSDDPGRAVVLVTTAAEADALTAAGTEAKRLLAEAGGTS